MSSSLAFITNGDTFHNDRRPDHRVDFILATPPFNVCNWDGERLRDKSAWKET